MILIPYSKPLHGVLARWWDAHSWPVIPHDALPSTGMIACAEEPVCAAFLYKTDSSIAWMEWFISDPQAEKRHVSIGLDMIIEELSAFAKEQGFKTIFTSMHHRGLIRRLERHGFKTQDTDVTQLMRIL